jgi:hypothetical protein
LASGRFNAIDKIAAIGQAHFVIGFTAGEESVWGRPVDVAFAHDGSMLFSEDGNGVIYRV